MAHPGRGQWWHLRSGPAPAARSGTAPGVAACTRRYPRKALPSGARLLSPAGRSRLVGRRDGGEGSVQARPAWRDSPIQRGDRTSGWCRTPLPLLAVRRCPEAALGHPAPAGCRVPRPGRARARIRAAGTAGVKTSPDSQGSRMAAYMALSWTARYLVDWADVRPERAGIEHEQAYLAGADEFAQLGTPLEFASLYLTAKCHLSCVHCHAEGSFQGTGQAGDVTTSTLLYGIYRLGQVGQRIQLTGGGGFARRDPGTGKNDAPWLGRAISALHPEPILQTTGIGLTPESTAFY